MVERGREDKETNRRGRGDNWEEGSQGKEEKIKCNKMKRYDN